MSYAVLYKANETDFNTLGLGVLRDAISPLVTEERNGQFELSMSYPVDGDLFSEIKNDRIIKADASQKLKAQRYKIIRITKPAGGIVKVYAEHVSYLSQDLALKPSVSYNGNATQALTAWKNNIVDEHPFTIFSDVQTTGSGVWTIDKVENARRALGGVAGSILDTYGGEYRLDNYHIGLYANRGSDSGALIAYGKNLTDIEQEEEIANTYTSIYPYTNIRDEEGNESLLTLPEYFVDSEYTSNYARRKIKTINFQQDDITTVEQLRERAQQYIVDNDIGVPSVNLTVKFVDLSKTLDYKDLALVEEINLCDQVTVYYEKLGIRQKAKVIKTIWNVALDRYEELVIGKARANLSQSIGTTVDGKLETVVTDLNSVRISADGKTKIFTGINEPIATNINDLWYKPVGDGEVEMYIWNGVVWSLQAFSGISEATKKVEGAVQVADGAKEDALKAIEDANAAFNKAVDAHGIATTARDDLEAIELIPGPKGDTGVSTYVHLAYSNSPDGSVDFSTTDSNRLYIGMYVDSNPTDSTTPSKYKWTLIKGADGSSGTPGTPGTDGKTPYLHIAYATNATGTTGFSTTDSVAKTHIGTYTDFVSADPTNPALYSWTLIKGETGATGATGSQGPQGAMGTSVTGVVEYYLATASATGITSASAGWTNSIQTVTPINKYLWNYEKINFSNGTSQDTLAVIIGTYGDTGRSIVNIVEYYLVTSAATGVTRSTSGWTTTMQTTTAINRHLWNYETITWSSGTITTYVEPIIIGIHGAQGPQGTQGIQGLQGATGSQGIQGPAGNSSYTHIAYSTSPTGATGFSTSVSTGATYIGMYVDSNAVDSETASAYNWTLIKGADGSQGIQGPTGSNGQTSYLHIAYATNSDGTMGFSTTESVGKTYIGQYTDFTAADSSIAASYKWTQIKGDSGPQGLQGVQGLQGATGSQGIAGTSSYTHIAYSTSPTGNTGFSTSNSVGATHIGMYVDSTPTDSEVASRYNWTLIKGADGSQGIQGPTGSNGQTSYLHIAYATNSTGSTGFSTTDSVGKTYIGQYTDFIAADSNTASAYSWTLIKGADGEGVVSITQYYYKSNSPTGLVGGSWTTAQPSWTNDTYIWSKTVVVYTDKPQYESTPVCISGKDGNQNYTWIKYAPTKNTSINDMVDTPSSTTKFIGMAYNKTTATESNVKSDYVWTSALEDVQSEIDGVRIIANSANLAASGKNTVYRGGTKPSTGRLGDIWFQQTAGGFTTYVHDGTDYIKSALDGSAIGGIINFGNVTAQNFDANSITTGNLQIDRGLKIKNGANTVMETVGGNVQMTVDNLLIGGKTPDQIAIEKSNSQFFLNAKNAGLVSYDSSGNPVSIFKTSTNGTTYIAGKNIVLDGDTVIDGSLTVTDTIFADTMDITKFKTGTFNASNINVINMDANAITTGTLTGANMSLNLVTGKMQFTNPVSGDTVVLDQGQIMFQNGLNIRHLKYSDEGLVLEPSVSNTGTAGNTSLIMRGEDGSHKYIDGVNTTFNDRQHHQRMTMINDVIRFHSWGGVEIRDNLYFDGRDVYNYIRAKAFLMGGSGSVGMHEDTNSWTRIDGTNGVALYAGGQEILAAYKGSPNEVDIFGNVDLNGGKILNQSDIRLKTNTVDSTIDPFSVIEKMRFIEFEWDKTNPYNKDKPDGVQFGVEAQYSPFLAVKDNGSNYLSINMGKQVNLNSMTNQKLISELKSVKQELADLKTLLTEKGVI